MRIAGTILVNHALDAMRTTLSNMARNQQRLATGRQIQSPADDPAGQAGATRLAARLSRIAQWKRQAQSAMTALDTNDRLLGRVGDIAAQAELIATSGADGAKGLQERQALAVEVDNFLNEVVDLVNARDDGRYVFGGRETLTAPLVATRNAQNQITAATWNPRGVDGTVDIEIGDGITVQANVGGTAVLGADTSPTFLPALLVSLRDALAANDQAAIGAALDPLASATARLASPVSDTGARLRQVQHALESLDAEEVGARAALSSIVDTDLARATLELSQQEVVYQAALQAAARAIQPTLLDFLR